MKLTGYQIIPLGPEKDVFGLAGGLTWTQIVVQRLTEALKDLQMSAEDLQVVGETDRDELDLHGAVAAVWFGTEGEVLEAEIELLAALEDAACPIFPVVDTVDGFERKVPEPLRKVNGTGRVEADWLDRLIDGILREWGLTREQRKIFISYRRKESLGAAEQLFHALAARGYGVFLDTVSVPKAAAFQECLWDSMSNVDLILFLDSPEALGSDWVRQEIANAANVGLGVVQVIWPEKPDLAETELEKQIRKNKLDEGFATPFPLLPAHFVGGEATQEAELEETRLAELLACVERVRIRSLGARRYRIVGGILDAAQRKGITATQQPFGAVLIQKASGSVGYGFVLPGIPDSFVIHAGQLRLGVLYDEITRKSVQARVIYNQIGLTKKHQDHIDWLNSYCNPKAQSLEKLTDWFDSLS